MNSAATEDGQSNKLLDTLVRVLVPLVRLMIAKGVTFQMASEVLKRAYVRSANEHFVEKDAASGTKLSLLTGLNRKEIRRLTSAEPEKERPPMASYATAVAAMWRTNRRWRDRDGKPKVLPRRTTTNVLSFDDLVRAVTTDHRPAAVIDEMTRLGIVELEAEAVRLIPSGFFSPADLDDKLARLSENIEDHMAAAVTNIIEPSSKFLEQSVFSDELSEASAATLHTLMREEWQKTFNTVIEKAIALEDDDAKHSRVARTRMRVGMYFYSEKSKEE
ncbi:MAG: DUF6502 family protein [Burkholderiales bacterium]|nr:DUF6502 family protein [Burkholderiales bacterium]